MDNKALRRLALCFGMVLLLSLRLEAQRNRPGAALQTAPTTTIQLSGPTAAERAAQTPTDSDIYCAGFYANRYIEPGLMVVGSEDGGFKNEYATHDFVYLSKGSGWINAPGGEYMVLRPVRDVNPRESFPGQHLLLNEMGTLYSQIAHIRVQVVQESSAIAEVLHACDPIVAGDIAVPFSARPAPAYKTAKITDRFAPASGKPSAVVVTAKEFDQALGEGKIVYLNIGSNRGAAVGSYLRVFRTYRDMDNDVFQQATSYYLPELTTLNAVPSMKRSERAQLPRSVLGEVMLLSVEDESATGIVTFSREEIFVGDEVEME